MSANSVDYFVPLLGEAGGWKGSEVKGWEFPGSLFQHASHCHCWYVYPPPPHPQMPARTLLSLIDLSCC